MDKVRSSNIELYRIIAMLAIVAHHFVVNSGLMNEVLVSEPFSAHTMFYYLFGMWGKTGINCFVLITGYFMCKSDITLRKFLKLYLQIVFYRFIIWGIFILSGRDAFSFVQAVRYSLPFVRLNKGFTPCFMTFFLFIPFLNILVRNMSQRQHLLLALLLLFVHTGPLYIPGGVVVYNYVSWFVTLFFIASYIRIYGLCKNDSPAFWGVMTLVAVIVAMLSVVIGVYTHRWTYRYVSDSPAIMAVLVSICSFMFYKNVRVKHSPAINVIASATFGVLLIHAHSKAMRTWLWRDVVDVVGHYATPHNILYACASVGAIFIVCCLLDLVRQYAIEHPVFKLLDRWLEGIPLYNQKV